MRARILSLGLGAVMLTPLVAAFAQQGKPAATDHVAALRACEAESDRTRKLACLEAASGALVAAVDSGELRLVDKAQREKQRRGLFGFSLPDIFGGDGDEDGGKPEMEAMQTMVSTITSIRQIDRKTYVFRIAEANAEWRIDEAPSRFIMPKVGETVEFKKAAMNSYFIRVGKQIGVKGKRIG
jgi:hypothetical protein